MSETFLIRARRLVPVEPAGAVTRQSTPSPSAATGLRRAPAAEVESRYPGAEIIDPLSTC
jgi:hypothetical protein